MPEPTFEKTVGNAGNAVELFKAFAELTTNREKNAGTLKVVRDGDSVTLKCTRNHFYSRSIDSMDQYEVKKLKDLLEFVVADLLDQKCAKLCEEHPDMSGFIRQRIGAVKEKLLAAVRSHSRQDPQKLRPLGRSEIGGILRTVSNYHNASVESLMGRDISGSRLNVLNGADLAPKWKANADTYSKIETYSVGAGIKSKEDLPSRKTQEGKVIYAKYNSQTAKMGANSEKIDTDFGPDFLRQTWTRDVLKNCKGRNWREAVCYVLNKMSAASPKARQYADYTFFRYSNFLTACDQLMQKAAADKTVTIDDFIHETKSIMENENGLAFRQDLTDELTAVLTAVKDAYKGCGADDVLKSVPVTPNEEQIGKLKACVTDAKVDVVAKFDDIRETILAVAKDLDPEKRAAVERRFSLYHFCAVREYVDDDSRIRPDADLMRTVLKAAIEDIVGTEGDGWAAVQVGELTASAPTPRADDVDALTENLTKTQALLIINKFVEFAENHPGRSVRIAGDLSGLAQGVVSLEDSQGDERWLGRDVSAQERNDLARKVLRAAVRKCLGETTGIPKAVADEMPEFGLAGHGELAGRPLSSDRIKKICAAVESANL